MRISSAYQARAWLSVPPSTRPGVLMSCCVVPGAQVSHEAVTDTPDVDEQPLRVAGELLSQPRCVAVDRPAWRAVTPHVAQQLFAREHAGGFGDQRLQQL